MNNQKYNHLISIVIVLYQEKLQLLRKCLKNLSNYKIIIIDNAGDKFLKKNIEHEFKIYKYILNKKNIGFPKAANFAIKLADTPFVLNFQADCKIANDDIIKLHESFLKYKDSFIISPTFYSDNNIEFNSGILPEKNIKQKILKATGDVCVETVLGSAIFFNKEEFLKIGGFDENFFLYFVDYDLCRRILSQKKSIIQINNVKVEHQHGNIKVNNLLKKVFIRNFNFTFDELYYYYKINKHSEIFDKLKKKYLNYKIKIFFNLLYLNLSKSTYYLAKVLAIKKFDKYLRKKN